MKIKLQVIVLVVLSIIAFACASHENDQKPVFNPHPSSAYLSPEETGSVEGKTYPIEMPSMAANRDGWIADVLRYARYEFGNKSPDKKNISPIVTRDEVKKVREEMKGRDKPWTLEELKKIK